MVADMSNDLERMVQLTLGDDDIDNSTSFNLLSFFISTTCLFLHRATFSLFSCLFTLSFSNRAPRGHILPLFFFIYLIFSSFHFHFSFWFFGFFFFLSRICVENTVINPEKIVLPPSHMAHGTWSTYPLLHKPTPFTSHQVPRALLAH